MIDRPSLVRRHNPVLTRIEPQSPLTLGNGEFAFTADITGLQSLSEYANTAPLCTMSHWGWHSTPDTNGRMYTFSDVELTQYYCENRQTAYAVESQPGNEDVYDWLRKNPHRLNLAEISLCWDGRPVRADEISGIRQELDLYTGVLDSVFKLNGCAVRVRTAVARSADAIGIQLRTDAPEGHLSVSARFPYGSHRITASDWGAEDRHTTDIVESDKNLLLCRTLDHDHYWVLLEGFHRTGLHSFSLSIEKERSFCAAFAPEREGVRAIDFDDIVRESAEGWKAYWHGGGAADFSGSTDTRAFELERRVVLSQYLCAVHSAGSIPPQETGLSCNSWYGKFHLEMHILHSGWMPLWGRADCLEKSFGWYERILDKAKENAARNGYKGARWPKMVGPEGIDSPSRIATLLIWQQAHILYMLELVRSSIDESESIEFMRKYFVIVRETADFMSNFATLNPNYQKRVYDLPAPLIPAQEEHDPTQTRNPAFELCYWKFGLTLAIQWAEALGENADTWTTVRDHLALPKIENGLCLAHENCPDTFERFQRDHPSMLFGYGFIPSNIDITALSRTADKVMDCWRFETAWGWDFALMAMTFTRLGRPEDAINTLLMYTLKNSYVASGNNFQQGRTDLPLYLPGNGSLLLALSMMLAGYGNTRDTPGFPKNDAWRIEFEGVLPLPY